MDKKKILTEEAIPGMIVAEDIYGLQDYLIISAGTEITNHSITRLKFYAIHEFYIMVNDEGETEQKKAIEENFSDSYSEHIKKTPEFKKFQEAFQKFNEDFKKQVSIISGKLKEPINEKKLFSSMKSILDNTRNGIHIMHMMHCMRDSDDVTYTHSLNVALLCNAFGHWLKYSEEDIHALTLAGLLHDIGKLTVPSAIMMKPSTLTPMEFELIKNHPKEGYLLLESEKLDKRIKLAVLQHHERIDGTGYPKGLMDNDIDNFAQIVSIVDIYVAMISPRIYRRANCPFEAMSVFEQEGFRKFKPEFILIFLENMANIYVNCTVRLSDERIGEIVMIDSRNITKPMVKVGEEFVDLSKQKDLFIRELI
ncbi:MAG: HD-GYP domain-containing protein [Clostridiales bacterium]|nr:HD-GYP domain-containing protein [Clostridiales bacterium]